MNNIKTFMNYSDIINSLYKDNIIKDKNIVGVPNVTFQITDECNLKCSYCYQINKGHHVMPLETAKKFIDLLLENNENTQQYLDTSQCKGIVLDFIGGEPLLQPKLIDNIITYFRQQTILYNHPWQYNWMISISSNGTLYFNQEVQAFIKKYLNHLSFNISIDGNKQLHDACRKFSNGEGSYDIAIAGVHHYINKFHGHMGSKMTLAPENIKYTFEAVKNLIEEGYSDIHLNCIFEKGWENKHATILYNQLKLLSDYIFDNNLEDKLNIAMYQKNFFHPKDRNDTTNWCGGNGRMIALDWKGDIFPCLRYMESSLGDSRPPIIIGNVNDGIMVDAKCRECINKLKEVNRISQSTEECIECPIAEGCAWCQAYNYQDSGDFNHRATYICCMHKARALANVYFWNKYYRKKLSNERFKNYLPDEDALKIINEQELQMLKKLEQPFSENELKELE